MEYLAREPNIVSKMSGLGTFIHANDPDHIAAIYRDTVALVRRLALSLRLELSHRKAVDDLSGSDRRPQGGCRPIQRRRTTRHFLEHGGPRLSHCRVTAYKPARQFRGEIMPRFERRQLLEKFNAMKAKARADHRRWRRHRAFRQMRRSRRHRSHRDLQFRPLSHGRAAVRLPA